MGGIECTLGKYWELFWDVEAFCTEFCAYRIVAVVAVGLLLEFGLLLWLGREWGRFEGEFARFWFWE